MMILEPIYEADFSQFSFGFRPNRRTMDAVKYLASNTIGAKKYYIAYLSAGLYTAGGSFSSPAWIPRMKAVEIAGLGIRQQYLARRRLTLIQPPRTQEGGVQLESVAIGKRAEAIQVIKELEAMSGASLDQAQWIAKIYAALNENDRALTWLERGLAAGALGALYKDDPVWDAISGDSRFGELLRRMGIQQ
jgi:hypothetical protein